MEQPGRQGCDYCYRRRLNLDFQALAAPKGAAACLDLDDCLCQGMPPGYSARMTGKGLKPPFGRKPGRLLPGRAKGCCLRYNSAMRSELLFILFLVAPWVLVLAAVFFYRQRRKRRTLDNSGADRNGGGRGA